MYSQNHVRAKKILKFNGVPIKLYILSSIVKQYGNAEKAITIFNGALSQHPSLLVDKSFALGFVFVNKLGDRIVNGVRIYAFKPITNLYDVRKFENNQLVFAESEKICGTIMIIAGREESLWRETHSLSEYISQWPDVRAVS